MIRIAFIINASRKLGPDVLSVLEKSHLTEGLKCTTHKTKREKDAIDLSREAAQRNDIIVAVGGDGTCNEVVNGIILSKNENIVFAVVPNGTGNDFHRMLGEFDPEKFVASLQQFKANKIDLCRIETDSGGYFCINIGGCGFDGFVVDVLNRQRYKLGIKGKGSYVLAIMRTFGLYRKPKVIIRSEEFNYKGKMLMIAACNGSTFGHGLVIHPKATLNSGYLGVTLLQDVSLIDYVRNLSKLKRGKQIKHPEAKYFKTKKITVRAETNSLYIQADGEPVGKKNETTFHLIPEAINLLNVDY